MTGENLKRSGDSEPSHCTLVATSDELQSLLEIR